jgi:hypothetical protein
MSGDQAKETKMRTAIQLRLVSFGSAKALTHGDIDGPLVETGARPYLPIG